MWLIANVNFNQIPRSLLLRHFANQSSALVKALDPFQLLPASEDIHQKAVLKSDVYGDGDGDQQWYSTGGPLESVLLLKCKSKLYPLGFWENCKSIIPGAILLLVSSSCMAWKDCRYIAHETFKSNHQLCVSNHQTICIAVENKSSFQLSDMRLVRNSDLTYSALRSELTF